MYQEETDQRERWQDIEREHAIRAHERNAETTADYLKAALDSSTVAIRSLILVNGAAVISLLAFLGAVESSDGAREFNSALLAGPIFWFALGVGLATATALLAYLICALDHGMTQSVTHTWEHPYVVQEDVAGRYSKWRDWLYVFAIGAAIVSLASFFCGICSVTSAISQSGI